MSPGNALTGSIASIKGEELLPFVSSEHEMKNIEIKISNRIRNILIIICVILLVFIKNENYKKYN